MKTLIVTPTYNERKNIRELVLTLFELNPDFHVLVVDDNSPDGTAEIVKEVQANFANLHLLSRNEKSGLGSAYIAGFNYALERDYEAVVQMDADMSHDPKDVSLLIEAIENADLSIGSRYISGINVVNWPLQRLIISYGANIYTRFVTRLPVRDATGGFKCWRRETLEAINLDDVRSQGYSFQIEMTYRVLRKQFRVIEVPILFKDRRVGKSKMSWRILAEAIHSVWWMRFRL